MVCILCFFYFISARFGCLCRNSFPFSSIKPSRVSFCFMTDEVLMWILYFVHRSEKKKKKGFCIFSTTWTFLFLNFFFLFSFSFYCADLGSEHTVWFGILEQIFGIIGFLKEKKKFWLDSCTGWLIVWLFSLWLSSMNNIWSFCSCLSFSCLCILKWSRCGRDWLKQQRKEGSMWLNLMCFGMAMNLLQAKWVRINVLSNA